MSEERISIPAVRAWEEQQEHEKRALEAALRTVDRLINSDYLAYNEVRLKTDNLFRTPTYRYP